MKQSTVTGFSRARLGLVCFFAIGILFLVSSSKPWAAGKLMPGIDAIKSTDADSKNNLPIKSSATATANFTLNQSIYPGNTSFTSLSPIPTTTTSPISSWSIGVPLLYVITIGNSNLAQNNLVNITLRDSLSPSTFDPNFVILKVSCDAFGVAVCPFSTNVPPSGTTLPLIVPNIQIKVGTEVVVRIEGYYKTQGSFQNTFSVFETGKQATTEEPGPAKKKASSCGTFVNDQTNFSHVTNLDVTKARDTLTVTGCPPSAESCPVKTNEISCKADGTSGYLYSFTVTNNTGRVVTDVLLTPPPNSGITIDPQQPPLPTGGIAIGASLTLQVTISGGKPEQAACFDVTLMTKDGECCTTRVCPVLPECCAVAKEESIECNKDGTFTYTMSIVNTGVDTIEHIYLYPADVTMTPNYFHVSLKPGNTFTTKVTIKGAKPGDKLCFDISLHTANMEKCCQGQQCIVLPACPVSGSRRP
jgi:hypothetical protein